jgi:hypothetical protein
MPDWKPHIRSRIASLRLSPSREQEIMEELAQHLDDRWRDLTAEGIPEEEAMRLTLAQLRDGALARNLGVLRQACQPSPITPGAPGTRLFKDLADDLRYAARMVRARPGFAAASS